MENKHWSSHVEFAVLLITLIGGFYTLDGKIERQIAIQSARSDKLYEMFYEVVRDRK